MNPWERRLKDLGQILQNCSETYFEPELFRMNTNQFLTTARTVTFIIQKNKGQIDSFDSWYDEHVLKKWGSDEIMKWAKDSRNQVEKVGDLELYSKIDVRLIFSYIEENDILIDCSDDHFVAYGIKKLIRYAQKKLPSGISDAAFVKIERRWVANNLKSKELLDAMVYVYARVYDCCRLLGDHVGNPIDKSIPETIKFDQFHTDSKNIRYVKLNGLAFSSVKTKSIRQVPISDLPKESVELIQEMTDADKPTSFQENHLFFSDMARKTYEAYGNHVPMLFLFNSENHPIDFLSAHFDDTASKYIFWRRVADRISYLKPASLIWISEAWIRELDKSFTKPIRSLPIRGEILQICSLNKDGKAFVKNWTIQRGSEEEKGVISGSEELAIDSKSPALNFLIPAISAFKS